MSLTEIEYGSLASSSVLNGNFQFLQDKITELSALITSETSSFSSTVATLNNSITELLGYKDSFIQTGTIIISQAPEIPSGFLLCDGSEIKIDEYEDLYAVIGTTYGQSDSTTFCIPDLTGRTVFGISEDGTLGDYLEAGLPNITGWIKTSNNWTGGWNGSSGAFTNSDTGRSNSAGDGGTGARGMQYNFSASRSSSIYGKSSTVQPPAMVTNFLIKY